MSWLRAKLLWLLWGTGVRVEVGACANRKWSKRMFGPVEFTVTTRHTHMPDGYSREELVEMLAIVRAHEKQMGWKVPESE